ncbi:FecCD family ABC transporter permease [Zhihengliuella salsuginis]|uniref:Iron ABC transporter permease n=1 Tax=Zhihengliuella salsuginis TaxID=578222 RepID=A0ABQ3GD92_9MICC|nr:iron ABC transporter permease [Zhihengliuella salsuginis]GHD02331.1 iron ABC transporter permease [Zhihengliuella salsuginis]
MTETLRSRDAGPRPAVPASGRTAPPKRVDVSRAVVVGLVLAAGVVVLAGLSLAVGARATSLPVVWDALVDFDPANTDHVVIHTRIPRTVTGIVVGAALALAGAAMQGITRNPLADPGILGLNAGAALAVVLGIHLFGIGTVTGYIWFAFAGAAFSAVVIYLVASLGREGATPVKLALAGAALAAGLMSVMHAILLMDQAALDGFRFWQVGVLGARSLSDVATLLPFFAAGALLVFASTRLFNALALGDDAATGLGVRVGRGRITAGLGVVLLAGGGTALAGPIAFLGLVIPHAIRLLTGADYRSLMPLSVLAGPVLLLGADVLGRIILPPSEVQVGVMTAVIGAPVFIWLIRTRKQVTL